MTEDQGLSISFSSEPTNGFYRKGPDSFAMITNSKIVRLLTAEELMDFGLEIIKLAAGRSLPAH